MSPHLDDLLYERDPAIFAARHLPATETSMCCCFACDDGWLSLIDRRGGIPGGRHPRHGHWYGVW